MSADSTSNCPACPATALAELKAAEQKRDAAYGTVGLEEYTWLSAVADEARAKYAESTRENYSLSEYYEIYYSKKEGAFIVDYSAVCGDCGWSTEFKYKHKVEI